MSGLNSGLPETHWVYLGQALMLGLTQMVLVGVKQRNREPLYAALSFLEDRAGEKLKE